MGQHIERKWRQPNKKSQKQQWQAVRTNQYGRLVHASEANRTYVCASICRFVFSVVMLRMLNVVHLFPTNITVPLNFEPS